MTELGCQISNLGKLCLYILNRDVKASKTAPDIFAASKEKVLSQGITNVGFESSEADYLM